VPNSDSILYRNSEPNTVHLDVVFHMLFQLLESKQHIKDKKLLTT
jgi:hypothetical protein